MALDNRFNQEKVASNLNKVLITEEIVNKKLCSLKINKAHGDDGMGSLMFKKLANELKGVFTIKSTTGPYLKVKYQMIGRLQM